MAGIQVKETENVHLVGDRGKDAITECPYQELEKEPSEPGPRVCSAVTWLCLLLPLLNSREQQREAKEFCLGLDTSPQLDLDMTQPWPSCPQLSQAGDQ